MTIEAIDNSRVSVGQPAEGGCCYVDLTGALTLPTDASTDLAAGFLSVGELSENGYTKSVSLTNNKFKGWHGSVMLTQISDEENTFKAEFTEIDRVTLNKLRYGASNVTTDTTDTEQVKEIHPTIVPSAKVAFVFEELLSNGNKRRTVYPAASIDSVDDETHQKGSLLLYGMTFTAAVDSTGHPYHIYEAVPATA